MRSPSLITPGEIYEYEIDLVATSNLFRAGHRIRLEVSSSNFPRFDRNPNTGEVPGRSTELVSAMQTIHHSREYPSRVVLPVVRSDG
jgi:putative CocE/NonD family hydrolase